MVVVQLLPLTSPVGAPFYFSLFYFIFFFARCGVRIVKEIKQSACRVRVDVFLAADPPRAGVQAGMSLSCQCGAKGQEKGRGHCAWGQGGWRSGPAPGRDQGIHTLLFYFFYFPFGFGAYGG
jgi:hypothetical protein